MFQDLPHCEILNANPCQLVVCTALLIIIQLLVIVVNRGLQHSKPSSEYKVLHSLVNELCFPSLADEFNETQTLSLELFYQLLDLLFLICVFIFDSSLNQ